MEATTYQSYAGWFNSIVDVLPTTPELLPATVRIIPLAAESSAKFQPIIQDYHIDIVSKDELGGQNLNIVALADKHTGMTFKKQDEDFPMGEFYRDLWSKCGEGEFTLTLDPIAH